MPTPRLAQGEVFARQRKIAELSLSGLTALTVPIPVLSLPYKLLHVEVWSHWVSGGTLDIVSLRLSTGGVIDAGANYDTNLTTATPLPTGTAISATTAGGTSISIGRGVISSIAGIYYSVSRFDIVRPAEAVFKQVFGESVSPDSGIKHVFAGVWKNTGVIDGISLNALVGNAWDSLSLVRVFGER